MTKKSMQDSWESSYLYGGSAPYLEAIYESYLSDPNSVSDRWRQCFDAMPSVASAKGGPNGHQEVSHAVIREHFVQWAKQGGQGVVAATGYSGSDKQEHVVELIASYRTHGHRAAKIDPLTMMNQQGPADLTLGYHQLSEADYSEQFSTAGFGGLGVQSSLRELHESLQRTYCGSIGFEFMHINNPEETTWLYNRIEQVMGKPNYDEKQKQRILKRLTEAEGLEKYLGRKYVGQKRFSLEGGGSLIPLMDELIQRGGANGIKEMVIGLAHRGRLNMLINILGKSTADLFAEFEGKSVKENMSGDVKYHMGFSSDVKTSGGNVHLTMAFNPSHLEIISPVVEGSVRARQERRRDENKEQVLAISIHGDAAFAGQGVVMETFNLSQTHGYGTGGTFHVVINNQIGFTTDPQESRSTTYCTDVAKMVDAPVFHVNGDDPEAVVFACQLAFDYRQQFKKDVVIDLVCYRRHGHNEADEPSATQPLMYKAIKSHKTPRGKYAALLVDQKIVTDAEVKTLEDSYRKQLDAGSHVVEHLTEGVNEFGIDWSAYLNKGWTEPADTTVPIKHLKKLGLALTTLPDGFTLQAQVAREITAREKMTAGELPINWGYAENLAYATLLDQGYPIRISGQDVSRGTFSHRHAVLHDQKTGERYLALQHLSDKQPDIRIINSILSEEAVLAYEYGYATADPNPLVIWEAQFGDFANGAQVVIDQFISSGYQKWGRLCGLVMLLPHGYEGQGPEHSSARLERYLQLCAEHNMQVCVPSTPAQAFHMFRRQMIRPYRVPLIVMSPKSLLRHKLAVSTLDELSKGEFQNIIPEVDDIKVAAVDRVVLCSGKVYYDLLEKRREEMLKNVALVRVEQLYPFPESILQSILAQYKKAKDVIWCQEEPMNQGAWYSLQHHMRNCLSKGQDLHYAGRPASASTAVGYPQLHQKQQQALVADALGLI